ncbi:MAG: Nicotinate dehydrogenase small FeS subunit [Verrucomicrobia bacterium ADurb.Bin345]|nr:MAG: Nicotinate dehydrogenase small FeS subunit [Verrucomicrobia bacterium ADurb.Bin345]
MKRTISIKLNGAARSADIDPSDILLDVLREKLGVKSPKIGCERGDCGVCTVIFNGRTVRSCLVLAAEADGGEIVTIEGLGAKGPTPLQQSFIKNNAFQCGFCAPGMVLAATELLEKNPKPDEHEIKEAISGNLCRCTGYEPIVKAIREVADSSPLSHRERAGVRAKSGKGKRR